VHLTEPTELTEMIVAYDVHDVGEAARVDEILSFSLAI
jgi:hypothetical protein